jgi:actin-related protein
MFGGDETGAIVIDAGSYSSKFGYGGDDAPKSIFLTVRVW